jgi:hypothetical protein
MRKKTTLGKHRPVVIKTKKGFKRPINSRIFPKPITLQGGSMKKGLPSKYAKMGFKKGWAAYKRGGAATGSKKGSRKRRHVLLGGDLGGSFSSPALLSKPVRKISSITPGKIISPIIDLGLLIIGMALGAGIKKASPIKNPHLMNGAQTVIGVGGSLLTKNRFVKLPLLGIALQSTIAEAKMLFPKMIPLAGDDEVVYLPVGEDNPQLEFMGEDDRFGAVVNGEGEEIYGDDDSRFGAVINGEDEEMLGEGNDS